MNGPIRILSDLHLGHRGSLVEAAEQLAPMLDGVGTVVCNGDTFEELAPGFRERGKFLLESWQRLLDERGVGLVALPGNHDPGYGQQGWLELAGGAFPAAGAGVCVRAFPPRRGVAAAGAADRQHRIVHAAGAGVVR